jgi:rubrerythrin
MRGKNNNYMVSNFAQQLGEYIQSELYDSMYYAALSQIAPDEEKKNILMGMSDDEEEHAKLLKREYYRLAGRNYKEEPISLEEMDDFKKAVLTQIKNEIDGFKTYNQQALNSPNRILKDVFTSCATSEAEHAMLLLLMSYED